MKLVLYGTEEKPNVVELEPRSLDNISSRSDLEDDIEDKQEDYVRPSREQSNFALNINTNWNDLVGEEVAVRQAGY